MGGGKDVTLGTYLVLSTYLVHKGQIAFLAAKWLQINLETSFLAHWACFQGQNVVLHQIYLGCYAKNLLLGKHSLGCHFIPNQLRNLKLGSFYSVSGAECGFI